MGCQNRRLHSRQPAREDPYRVHRVCRVKAAFEELMGSHHGNPQHYVPAIHVVFLWRTCWNPRWVDGTFQPMVHHFITVSFHLTFLHLVKRSNSQRDGSHLVSIGVWDFKMMKLLFLGLLAKDKCRICSCVQVMKMIFFDQDQTLPPARTLPWTAVCPFPLTGPCLGLQYVLFTRRISSVCPCFCQCLRMACFGPPSCVEEFWPGIFWTFPWLLYVTVGLRKEEHGNTVFSFCSIKVQNINMTTLGGLAWLTYRLSRSLVCLFHSIPYFLKDVSIPGHTYEWALYSPTRARNLPKLYGFFT